MTIKPALTAEEWARSYRRIQCFESWEGEVRSITGVGEIVASDGQLLVTSHEHSLYAVFSAQPDRHALAALALYGQPFGLSREDVEEIRGVAGGYRSGDWGFGLEEYAKRMDSIADRIEALLPPAD